MNLKCSAFHSSPLDGQLPKIISQIIRNCYPGPCETYEAYPNDTKKVIMKEFLGMKIIHNFAIFN
jgi:hypothetical protein